MTALLGLEFLEDMVFRDRGDGQEVRRGVGKGGCRDSNIGEFWFCMKDVVNVKSRTIDKDLRNT